MTHAGVVLFLYLAASLLGLFKQHNPTKKVKTLSPDLAVNSKNSSLKINSYLISNPRNYLSHKMKIL